MFNAVDGQEIHCFFWIYGACTNCYPFAWRWMSCALWPFFLECLSGMQYKESKLWKKGNFLSLRIFHWYGNEIRKAWISFKINESLPIFKFLVNIPFKSKRQMWTHNGTKCTWPPSWKQSPTRRFSQTEKLVDSHFLFL